MMVGDKKLVAMTVADEKAFGNMPAAARIKLRLIENKVPETLEFGTLGAMRTTAEIKSGAYSAPSCQLRIVPTEAGKGAGTTRRLANVRRQLDVTWDLEDLDPGKNIVMLPKEFSRFKPKPVT